ncbi:hypothetical protein TNCV_1518021 [Trichonephila clavipes]|nr:hypothetical protein TNCV_1518021 [Trichonephila clavipes]
MLGKKKLKLQEDLDFLQNLKFESSDALTDATSVEGVPANNTPKFWSDPEEDDQDSEQNPGCSSSENTVFPTPQDAVL